MVKSKKLLRQELITARRALSNSARVTKSQQIEKSLKKIIPWSDITNLHIYESIDDLNEVQTGDFINYLLKNYPVLKIYTARKTGTNWKNVGLNCKPAETISFDAIVVPMLGFDDDLNRLGYGGGYYDKFLSQQVKAQKIGLCFEIGHKDKLLVESHDIAMNCVISDKQIYR